MTFINLNSKLLMKRIEILKAFPLLGLFFIVRVTFGQVNFSAPSGDWDYKFDGDQVNTSITAALDGNWNHGHTGDWDPDDWDGSAPGSTSLNGGVGAYIDGNVSFIRLQDVGYIGDKPNNNRINFTKSLPANDMLDNGFTLAFRLRLAIPSQGYPLDAYRGAKDYENNSFDGAVPEDGKGIDMRKGIGAITLAQTSSVTAGMVEQIGLTFLNQYMGPDQTIRGLSMNNLVGSTMLIENQDYADSPPRSTAVYNRSNVLEMNDVTIWHEFWIQISADGTEGTHKVKVWHDDVRTPVEFSVTSTEGIQNGQSSIPYIMMGAGINNGNASAYDLDYIAYKDGLHDPEFVDCAGVAGGEAYIDDCGECVGGTTGLLPNQTCEQDCNGTWGGNAFIDSCGDCVGGTTGKIPCATYKKDRALIVKRLQDGNVYMSWRLWGVDPDDVAFNVYRAATEDGEGEKRNSEPITQTTDFIDGPPNSVFDYYWVVPFIDGVEGQPSDRVRISGKQGSNLSEITLAYGGSGMCYGIYDLNGDGRLDWVIKSPDRHVDPWPKIWEPSNGTIKLDAYLHDGTPLWRHDCGFNIEVGQWYFCYSVADFDGDGIAEVALKMSDESDHRDPPGVPLRNAIYFPGQKGRVQSGPEWLGILNGMTGEVIDVADWPSRDGFEVEPKETEENYTGTEGYNRASRNLMIAAYTNGADQPPIIVVHRGTYGRMKTFAFSFDGEKLTKIWELDTDNMGEEYEGQGAHFMHAMDVDGDGRDEIFLGSTVVDDDGSILWSNFEGDPDAVYVGDIMPDNPGLEVYFGYEASHNHSGLQVADAATGEEIWGSDFSTDHIHSEGFVGDVLPEYPGMECYGGEEYGDPQNTRYLFSAYGELISSNPVTKDNGDGDGRDGNELEPKTIFWDADLSREVFDEGEIFDFPYEEGMEILSSMDVERGYYIADVVGDWREELIESEGGTLRIYVSTIPAEDKRPWLMEDPVYRRDVMNSTHGYIHHPMLSRSLIANDSFTSVLQPEEACNITATEATTITGYTASSYLEFGTAGSGAEWRIGTVRSESVSVRVYYTADEASKLDLMVDGTKELELSFAATPDPSSWKYIEFDIRIDSGVHDLGLQAIEGETSPCVDRIQWINDFLTERGCDADCNGVIGGQAFTDDCGVCAGEGTGIEPNTTCEKIIQAEDYCAAVSASFNEFLDGTTGEGAVTFSLVTDASITFGLESDGENLIELFLRYANASNIISASLYVNDVLYDSYVPFRKTGGVQDWSETSTPVGLENGENMLEFRTNAKGLAILDKIYWHHSKVTAIDCSLNIERKQDISVMFYPNPVKDRIYLENLLPGKINIYDVNGKLIRQHEIIDEKTTIPVGELKAGIYLLRYSSEDMPVNAAIKFVK